MRKERMMSDEISTSPQQFKKWYNPLTNLDIEPWLIPLSKGSKFPDVPKGESWKEERFRLTKEQAIERLENNKNVGFVPKGRIVFLDIDNVEEADKILKVEDMPTPLACQSRSGKPHLYFKNGGLGNKEISNDSETIVELRTKDRYGVAPGSFVPSKEGDGLYKVTEPEIPETLEPKHLPKELRPDHCEILKEEKEIDITKVVPTEGLHKEGNRLQGPHPIHGSEHTNRNFTVNPEKNVWHCHRHNSGGGPFSYIAMEEDLIDCEEAKKGALRGEKWNKTIEKALKRELITGNEAKKLTGKDEGEEDRKKIETSKVEVEDFLAEQIITKDGPAFAFLKDGEVKIEKEIQKEDEIYVPRDDDAVETESVLLPSDVEDYESTKKLVEEIREIIHRYVDVSERYEKLASWYVVTTWVYDELSTLSYLRALGDTGTGKSRLLDVVGRMCYKPIKISGAVTPAPIYRLLKQWKGTLIIDEADMRKSDAKNEVVTILNCGFERGRPVIRCTKDNPDNIQFHETFGPKIIATRQEFNDKALESRCLTEKMTQTSRKGIPDQLPEEFFEKAEEMRNKLLKWRLESEDKVNLKHSRKIDMGNIEPRLKQATRGFLAVFDDKEIQKELFDFLKNHQRELVEQRTQTWEGMTINVIHDNWKEEKETLDEGVDLWPKKIAEEISEKYGEERVTAARVGKILRGMNLKTKRKRIYVDEGGEDGGKRKRLRVLEWDKDKLKNLFRRYVPDFADFELGGTGGTDGTGRTVSPALASVFKN